MGETFAELASAARCCSRSAAAALAGLVSFLSPCVLPLVPGYLSYVTGLAGADLDRRADAAGDGVAVDRGGRGHGRVLAGTVLFIAGFTVVFTPIAILFAGVGWALFDAPAGRWRSSSASLIIVLGLAFLGARPRAAAGVCGSSGCPTAGPARRAGVRRGLRAVLGPVHRARRSARCSAWPRTSAARPTGRWCSPSRTASGSACRSSSSGWASSRLLGLFRAIRRNSRWVTRVGGALLILVGLALVTGGWNSFMIWLQTTSASARWASDDGRPNAPTAPGRRRRRAAGSGNWLVALRATAGGS